MSRVIEVGPRGGKRVGFYYDRRGKKHYRYERDDALQRPAAAPESAAGAGRDPRLPPHGQPLFRTFKGTLWMCRERPDGSFEIGVPDASMALKEPRVFSSLSKAASHVTGNSVNGYAFFGLTGKVAPPPPPPPPPPPKPDAPKTTGTRDPRLPTPGTAMWRLFRGERWACKEIYDGSFIVGLEDPMTGLPRWEPEQYQSLSKAAQRITGNSVNGYAFFKLEAGGSTKPPKPPKPPQPKPDEPHAEDFASALSRIAPGVVEIDGALSTKGASPAWSVVCFGEKLVVKQEHEAQFAAALERVMKSGTPAAVRAMLKATGHKGISPKSLETMLQAKWSLHANRMTMTGRLGFAEDRLRDARAAIETVLPIAERVAQREADKGLLGAWRSQQLVAEVKRSLASGDVLSALAASRRVVEMIGAESKTQAEREGMERLSILRNRLASAMNRRAQEMAHALIGRRRNKWQKVRCDFVALPPHLKSALQATVEDSAGHRDDEPALWEVGHTIHHARLFGEGLLIAAYETAAKDDKKRSDTVTVVYDTDTWEGRGCQRYETPIGRPAQHRISLEPNSSATTVAHELAHGVEYVAPWVANAARAWRREVAARGTPNGVPQYEKLSVLAKDDRYKPEEVALQGRFVHPYAGKVYAGRESSEVITMGVQDVYLKAGPMGDETMDHYDHFVLIDGMIDGVLGGKDGLRAAKTARRMLWQ